MGPTDRQTGEGDMEDHFLGVYGISAEIEDGLPDIVDGFHHGLSYAL